MSSVATVEVVPYDPRWPDWFAAQAAKIRTALGEDALGVVHVGSTAVPGLCAKPVIDIHLTVRDAADEASYLARLEAAGYRLLVREPEWFEHRMLKGRDPEVNLHVFSDGCAELDRCVAFRDWLRDNTQDRELYAGIKRELAERRWESVDDYARAKNEVVSAILGRALAGSHSS
jgi:GrpB-like predicted nucleotidyltransferase (UPF0157 family)